MNCDQCGWPIKESIDAYCSGCGRCLRRLKTDSDTYRLYMAGFGEISITVYLEGILPLDVQDPWLIDAPEGIDHFSVSLADINTPPVRFMPGAKMLLQIQAHSKEAIKGRSKGKVTIPAGVSPPLEINIICAPMPDILIGVNNIPVRHDRVSIVTEDRQRPELIFTFEAAKTDRVKWSSFELSCGTMDQNTIEFDIGVDFPLMIENNVPFEFKVCPVLPPSCLDGGGLVARFDIEGCKPVTFQIDLIPAPKIIHSQDVYLVDRQAIPVGDKKRRTIQITLENQGAVGARIHRVRSGSYPWLIIDKQPDMPELAPHQKSKSRFQVAVEPSMIDFGTLLEAKTGEIIIEYNLLNDAKNQITAKTIPLAVEIKAPEALHFPLAIDFGNTATCVAFIDDRYNRQLVALDEKYPDRYEFPSMIEFGSFAEGGDDEMGQGFSYGFKLEETRFETGQNLIHRIWGIKQLLAKPDDIIIRTDKQSKQVKRLSNRSICEWYLKEVVNRFVRLKGYRPLELIATYPASFTQSQINILREICEARLPGINIIMDISEPEAAALCHIQNLGMAPNTQKLFAVCDFGGEATNITIFQIVTDDGIKKTVKIIVNRGFNDLGGDALTYQLAKQLYETTMKSFDKSEYLFPSRPNDVIDPSSLKKETLFNFINFMNIAESVKINSNNLLDELLKNGRLTIRGNCHPCLDNKPCPCSVHLTHEEFNALIQQYVKPPFENIKDEICALRQRGTPEPEGTGLDFLIINGNASRLPMILEMAQEILNLSRDAIYFDAEMAKTGVAMGAALYGQLLDEADPEIVFNSEKCLKLPIGINKGGIFHEVFAVGATAGSRVQFPVTNFRRLILYRNHDLSEKHFSNNTNIRLLGEPFDLSQFGKKFDRCDLQLELVNDGIDVRLDHQPAGHIAFDW